MENRRENSYWWIKYDNTWVIGKWENGNFPSWWICGCDEPIKENEVDEIGNSVELCASAPEMKAALKLIVKSFPRKVLSDQVGEEWNEIEKLLNNLL